MYSTVQMSLLIIQCVLIFIFDLFPIILALYCVKLCKYIYRDGANFPQLEANYIQHRNVLFSARLFLSGVADMLSVAPPTPFLHGRLAYIKQKIRTWPVIKIGQAYIALAQAITQETFQVLNMNPIRATVHSRRKSLTQGCEKGKDAYDLDPLPSRTQNSKLVTLFWVRYHDV